MNNKCGALCSNNAHENLIQIIKTLYYLRETLKGRCKPQTVLELFLHTPQTWSYIRYSYFYLIYDICDLIFRSKYICKLHKPCKAAIIILIVKWIQGYCPKHNIFYSLIQENKYVGKYSYIDASLGFELLDCYDR